MNDAAPTSPRELRPVKGPFVAPRVIVPTVLFLAVGLIAGVALNAGGAGVAFALGVPAVSLLLTGLVWWAALVAFRKERYELHPTFLRCQKGGLVSDESTELEIRKITHVKVRLPWLRYKFFRVGDVIVESAGSSDSEIHLRSVLDPEGIYKQLSALMQQNGYSLRRGTLLHEEQPDLVGVIVECLGLLVTAALALLWFVGSLMAEGASDTASSGAEGILGPVFVVIGLVVVAGGFGRLVVHFLDLRRRTYRVFDDAVVYEEGFLTRDNAFIPYENIADANSKRTLLDQILGLYDVQVSCQGSGQEIKFRRLRGGPALTQAIGKLIEDARSKPHPESERVPAQPDGPGLDLPPARPEPELVAPEQAWTAELKPNLLRVLVGYLPMAPAFPLWILASIQALINTLATTYTVRPSSVKSSYNFLSANEREFAYDKITGVVVKETPLDRLLGTFTVRLWSIGASQPLDLAHVKRDEVDLPALMRQAGIPPASQAPYEVSTRFGFGVWLRGRLPVAVMQGMLALFFAVLGATVDRLFFVGLVLVVLGTAASIVYQHLLYARQRLSFHDHHAQAEMGIFWRSQYYARYSNIKKVGLTRYPGCDQGSLRVFVAGEMRMVQGKGKAGQEPKQAGAVIPYSFTAHFVEGLEDKLRLIDDVLLARSEPRPGAAPAAPLELLREGQPSLGNALFRVIGLSLVVFPLIVLLPLTVPFTILSVRRRRYRVEAGRVLISSGILFRSQTSVLFSRIDSLRQGEGVLNKMFKNGVVTLLTAGSSAPDLVLSDLPGHKEFYDEIRPHYVKQEG